MVKPKPLVKLGLTAHIIFSVGWFGAVAAFFVLALNGYISKDPMEISSVYISLKPITQIIIVPFCLASLITGLIQSFITKWALFRYYWVATKFGLTLISTIILLIHINPIETIAEAATKTSFVAENFQSLRIQLLADAGAALLVLLLTTAISIYKPWGLIAGTASKEGQQIGSAPKMPISFYFLLAIALLLIIIFIASHLISGNLHKH